MHDIAATPVTDFVALQPSGVADIVFCPQCHGDIIAALDGTRCGTCGLPYEKAVPGPTFAPRTTTPPKARKAGKGRKLTPATEPATASA